MSSPRFGWLLSPVMSWNNFLEPCKGGILGFRYDGKARAESNFFDRWYNCRSICESCLAQRRTSNSNPDLWFFDFRDSSPRHLTRIDDRTYRQTATRISPYHQIEGWTLGTCLRDIMHVIYLGIAKDMIPSLIADWLDHNVLGPPGISVDDRLRSFSLEMHQVFRREKTLIWN